MTLRSLSDVEHAARNQRLEIIPTLMREVLFECPACKNAGLRSLACIEIHLGQPHARCKGCTMWGEDPYDILSILGHNPAKHDEFEIVLRVFDLLWAIERAAQRGTIRDTQSGREPRNKSNPDERVTGCPSTSLTRQPNGVSTP